MEQTYVPIEKGDIVLVRFKVRGFDPEFQRLVHVVSCDEDGSTDTRTARFSFFMRDEDLIVTPKVAPA